MIWLHLQSDVQSRGRGSGRGEEREGWQDLRHAGADVHADDMARNNRS